MECAFLQSGTGRGSAWLKDCQVDVLLLTEVNPGWAKHLREISTRWPHQICEPRNGAAGIWLLSRWPLTQVEAAGISPMTERPWIACTVEMPQGNVSVSYSCKAGCMVRSRMRKKLAPMRGAEGKYSKVPSAIGVNFSTGVQRERLGELSMLWGRLSSPVKFRRMRPSD